MDTIKIAGIEIKKGNRIPQDILKREGFRKLSKNTLTDGKIKITLKGRKIERIENQRKYWQMIQGFKGSGGNSSHTREVMKCCR